MNRTQFNMYIGKQANVFANVYKVEEDDISPNIEINAGQKYFKMVVSIINKI